MKNSEVLRQKIQLASGGLAANLQRLWEHRELDRVFPAFLILLHQIIRASVPLMQRARKRSLERPGDSVCALLGPYLHEHIAEEMHHDTWTIEDLESAGFPGDLVLEQIPSPNVAAAVGAQYYWIEHVHPVALLGYITVLEGNSVTAEELDDLCSRSGLPESLFRTYRLHGELDPQHKLELDALLDSLPLDRTQSSLVGISAMQTVLVLSRCIRDVLSQPPPVPRLVGGGAYAGNS